MPPLPPGHAPPSEPRAAHSHTAEPRAATCTAAPPSAPPAPSAPTPPKSKAPPPQLHEPPNNDSLYSPSSPASPTVPPQSAKIQCLPRGRGREEELVNHVGLQLRRCSQRRPATLGGIGGGSYHGRGQVPGPGNHSRDDSSRARPLSGRPGE